MKEEIVKEIREELTFVKNGQISVNTVEFCDYTDLLYTVRDMINMCSEACLVLEMKTGEFSMSGISNVLKLAGMLLPCEDIDTIEYRLKGLTDNRLKN